MPERKIFRQSAITAYQRSIEKDVVPRLISWPIIVCMWLLLGVFIAAGFLAWYIQVPTYVDGPGVILAQEDILQRAYRETVAVVFLTPEQSAHVQVGLPADVQVGSAGSYVRGTVANVEPNIMSPHAARKSYRLQDAWAPIAQPSVVVIVRLGTTLPPATYAGSIVTAKVEIGSRRLIELLPGLGKLFGSSS